MQRAEVGIDYLTATLPLDDENANKMLSIGHKLQKEAKSEGNTIKPYTCLGYEGALCGSIFVGSGIQGSLVRVSSQKATEAAISLKVVKPKISRIDLQVTVFYPADSDVIVRRHYEQAFNAANVADKRARRTIGRYEKNDGGYTVVVGSRSSNYYGRVYDKHKESKDDEYKGAIRYEVEVKGEAALQVYSRLRLTHGQLSKQIASFVGDWYAARGISPAWTFQTGELDVIPIKREQSDTERRLKWLRTQVRHTCMMLRSEVDTTVILEALGFFEDLPPESGEEPQETA